MVRLFFSAKLGVFIGWDTRDHEGVARAKLFWYGDGFRWGRLVMDWEDYWEA